MTETVTANDNFPLRLTSPYKQGERVLTLQHYLHSNRHKVSFLDLHGRKPSGVYDPATASAVHRAKWWLGYPSSEINGVVRGRSLLGYLVGSDNQFFIPLSPAMKQRHLKRTRVVPIGEKALKVAETQIGYSPGNCSSYAKWYGLPCDAWCAMFLSWCFAQVGGGFRYAYVPSILHDAQVGTNHLTITTRPVAGDLVIYVWGGPGSDPNGDHVGIARAIAADSVESVDGNTGDASPGGGGQVLSRVRPRSLVRAFVHVSK